MTKKMMKKKESNETVSISKLIGVILVLSLLMNFYLFYQSGVLKSEQEALTQQILEAKQGGSETSPRKVTPKASTSKSETKTSPTGEKAELTFYVMSQCPYGIQVLDAITPILKQVGDYVDFKVDYIATENPDGSFQALHGQPEVDGNIAELCAAKYNPQDYEYMDMIVCMDRNSKAIPGNWEDCAQKTGLDVEKIRTCYGSAEGKQLLSESAKRAQAAGARGSPTIFLNGKRYSGGRQGTDFLSEICSTLKTKPSECDNIPQAAPRQAQRPSGGCGG